MLIRLYSDTGLLVQNINFEPGINIIYGKYSGESQAKGGINGIGKSSLVRLINYMLLSDTAEKEFNKSKYAFLRTEFHQLTLEFQIGETKYFISRYFTSNDKIHFGKTPTNLIEYEKTELLIVLSGLFFPVENNQVYVEGNKFRTLMQFFIKDDLQNKSRPDPTNFFSFTPNVADKAIYNFYLLGLPTKHLINFAEISKEYTRYRDALKTNEEKLKADTGYSVEEYRSERLKLESNVRILKERLNSYDFKDSHKEIEKKLTGIIQQINNRSQEYHTLSQKLKNIREAYQLNQEIDTLQVEKIYNEVLSNFGNAIKKSLDEIKVFKSEILENRNKFLVSKEKELENSINTIFLELSKLENSRTVLLKNLKEIGVLDKLEKTYEELINEQSQVERQNLILSQIDEYNLILSNQQIVLSEVRRDILEDIRISVMTLNTLRELFTDILSSALFLNEDSPSGYFDVAISKSTDRTKLPFKVDVSIPKSGSLGQEDLKMIAYDIMIFLNLINKKRSLPDFLIHDGVFGNMSHKTMVNYLNYIYRTHLKLYPVKNFQYIVTFSEDEIEVPANKIDLYGEFEFDFNHRKIIVLEDVATKMLFKRDISQ
ncbi:DUF2326 domain-containing protein [Pedobacter antarcticus]|uniref:DUF2326 domain-containing protein n=1 Tax=Pedobacter antarcticus TaxID=34086 RepID=UPI00088FBAE8|nr:DUF2326 domain-containing protein [Pedobacter antarcticus]SDL47152.1 Uncharacterized protein YydD, contains DUF2326 domain [Pedobacter antarcticus]